MIGGEGRREKKREGRREREETEKGRPFSSLPLFPTDLLR
jgi:hypothetical protein